MAKSVYIGIGGYDIGNVRPELQLTYQELGDYVYRFDSVSVNSAGQIVGTNPQLVSLDTLTYGDCFIEQSVYETVNPIEYVYQVSSVGSTESVFCYKQIVYDNGKACKIKKGYIGINGVARKIKKAYIGVGGVARPCWGGGVLAYYGTATNFNKRRDKLAATTIGDYALFGGGYFANDGAVDNVDVYNTLLTRSGVSTSLTARYCLAATAVGNYAIFGGGTTGQSLSGRSMIVQAYDASLTRTKATNLQYARAHLAATTIGDYALFAGGGFKENSRAYVDAYNGSLTHSIATELSVGRRALAATTVGNYALFAGGRKQNDTTSEVVDVYNMSLTRMTAANLSDPRYTLAATTIGDYALFGGGYVQSDIVDVYDNSLTHTIATNLSLARYDLAATTVGKYALFGGGYTTQNSQVATVDAYTVV